jgi:O-antigen/teichoic acid export membrane protein
VGVNRLSQKVGNLCKTVGASGAQLVITLVATPIMTRLYMPEAYATFGIVNTAATVMVGIGLLTLPNAYTAEKDNAVRDEMLHAMLLLLVGTVACAALAGFAVALTDRFYTGIDVPLMALLCLPVLVMTYGVRQIITNMGIQQGIFGRLSLGQVAEPVCSRGGSIVLGAALGGNPLFILWAVMAGHVLAAWIVMRRIPRATYAHWKSFMGYRVELRSALRRVGDFVIYGTAAQQTQQLVMLGLQVGIAGFFSGHLAGQYILAISILTMPVSMVALATAPVVYHHFIETKKHQPQRLLRDVLSASAMYLGAGLILLLPIAFFGEPLFRFVFGDIWGHAGSIASMLSVAYIGTFVLTGVQSVFMVTRRLRLQFYVEILTALPALLAAVICFKMMDFDTAVFYLSAIWLVRALVLFAACLVAATHHTPVDEETA